MDQTVEPKPKAKSNGWKFQHIDDGPRWCKRAAQMRLNGASIDRCAVRLGKPLKLMQQLFNYKPVREYMREITTKVDMALGAALAERQEKFDEMIDRSLGVLDDVLQDPEAAHKDKIKVAELVLDRDPRRQFMKATKQEVSTTHTHIATAEALDELKHRALQYQREKELAIPVAFEVINEDGDEENDGIAGDNCPIRPDECSDDGGGYGVDDAVASVAGVQPVLQADSQESLGV